MTHLTDEELALLAGDDLPEPEIARAHLINCPECQSRYDEYIQVESFLSALADEPLESQRTALHRAIVLQLAPRRSATKWAWWTAAAAVIIGALGISALLATRPAWEPPRIALRTPPPPVLAHWTVAVEPARHVRVRPLRLAPLVAGIRSAAEEFEAGSAGIRLETTDPKVVILLLPEKEVVDEK